MRVIRIEDFNGRLHPVYADANEREVFVDWQIFDDVVVEHAPQGVTGSGNQARATTNPDVHPVTTPSGPAPRYVESALRLTALVGLCVALIAYRFVRRRGRR